MYKDGLASDGAGSLRKLGGSEPFGAERLRDILAQHSEHPPKTLLANLISAYSEFVGNAPDRDATLLLLAKP